MNLPGHLATCCAEWIDANCGADRKAWEEDFYQKVKAATQQHGILQPDGTFVMSRCTPRCAPS